MSVDLHTHTTYSDGTFAPSDLIKFARRINLTAIAITDHDIVSANNKALSGRNDSGVKLVPGVELSVNYDLSGGGHLHILGLFINPNHALLNQTLQNLRVERLKRNQKILRRLKELNMPLTAGDINLVSKKGSVGRPHIAAAMVKRGYVSNIREAFQDYLKKGSSAYFDKMTLDANQAIDIIHLSGGLAIIAHPASLELPSLKATEEYILYLKSIGLDGIEAYYSGQDEQTRKHLLKFARENRMVVSGGSDFHGSVKPEIQLGSGSGDLNVPDHVYEDLVVYWEEKKYKFSALL